MEARVRIELDRVLQTKEKCLESISHSDENLIFRSPLAQN
jgi:hypothetical protein